jgi:tetratricopeptide (TPR) repeat protein
MNRRFETYSGSRRQARDIFGDILKVSASLILFAGVAAGQQRPAPDGPDQSDRATVEKWRADLRHLAEELPRRHKNLFHTMTREHFERAVKRLDDRIPQLAPHEIMVEMSRIVASVGDGHTRLGILDSKFGFRQYPIRLYLYRDGLFVQAATADYAQVVGTRVIKIGAATAEEAFKSVSEITPRDNDAGLRHSVPLRLVVPEVLHALRLIDDMEKTPLVVEKQGQQFSVELKPLDPKANVKWVDARDAAQLPPPLWLKDPQNRFWFEYLADSRAVYVQYNEVQDKPNETLADFWKRVFAFVESNPVDRFILDIRLNGGGNGFLNQSLIHNLIRCDKVNQRGRLFTIIGRRTFSAAGFLAIDLERHTKTLFVGEPTGARPNHYGESARFALPHSGLTVGYSSLYWQYSDPRDTRPWVPPHLAAELTSADYAANHDPALQAILDYKPQPPLEDLMLEVLLKENVEAAIKRYREFNADSLNAYANTQWSLRLVGRRLMNAHKRFDDAIEIFKLNLAERPRSDESLFLLADAYERAGKKDLAAKNYEAALQLNPQNWEALDALRSLRAKAEGAATQRP